ncbi:hypothetical protein Spock_188 [Bacillus phage Spock]|uniref:Uncharacterized protein n=1 Tax=Bacillus phage Spock TaxID=1406791 RepID=U5Q120_9CAUD|nr:hypothetical protein Spock_188 [Bacillus phage Spock]AGY48588.1 hypothetical protein Spock_188 [Bacillus phage Spock]
MNLYREVSSSELVDKIMLAFEEYGLIDFATISKVEKSIKVDSKSEAKRTLKSVLPDYSWWETNDLHKELDKLYRALGLINRGQKVYTDL